MRVAAGVDFGKGGDVHVGVYLRGFHSGVTEHFLHVADVGPSAVHRGGAGVAEQVTGAFGRNSREFHLSGDPGAEVGGCDPGSVTAQEHGGFRWQVGELRA